MVQGVLEGGDDVCQCKAGLKWCGDSRRGHEFVSSRLRDGIEMVIEDMSNGTRAHQHHMEEAASRNRAGGKEAMNTFFGKQLLTRDSCAKEIAEEILYIR